MRCFIAIEFDERTKSFLAKLQDSLRTAGVKGNYTAEDNFHLTLKFLGEIDHKILNGLEPLLMGTALEFKPFVLAFSQLGKFNKGNSSIIWCGLVHEGRLFELQRSLNMKLEAGFPEFGNRSAFSPHITLVREARFMNSLTHIRPPGDGPAAGERLDNLFTSMGKPEGKFTANGLSLMESTRIEGKLRYVMKKFFAFKA